MKQTQRSGLECQIQEMCLTVLPALLKDMATLKVTTVLHGDHDLKLARQEYFNSKQTKVSTKMNNLRSFVPWLVLLSCVLKHIFLSCK